MNLNTANAPRILVVEDVEETCVGIERLLRSDDYAVIGARDETEAISLCHSIPPDLVLMSLGVDAVQLGAIAKRIRERAGLSDTVPIVLFCVTTVDEGAPNLYLTRSDNFNQLRRLFGRLLRLRPRTC